MSIRNRLDKLESLASPKLVDLPRPKDVDEGRWQAVLALLRELPAEKFRPWRDLAHVVEWVQELRPNSLRGYPDPVTKAFVQVAAESEGQPVPDWLWNMRNLSDEELREIVRQCEDAGEAITEGQQT